MLTLLRIVNSPFGRVLQAIRQNEIRVTFLGYAGQLVAVLPALHAHVIPRHASEDPELRRKPVWLHDWSAAPGFSDALVPLARRIAGRLLCSCPRKALIACLA